LVFLAQFFLPLQPLWKHLKAKCTQNGSKERKQPLTKDFHFATIRGWYYQVLIPLQPSVYLYLKIRTPPPPSLQGEGMKKATWKREKLCRKRKMKIRKIYRFITNGKSKGKIVHEQ
jgi:hypothetical protein